MRDFSFDKVMRVTPYNGKYCLKGWGNEPECLHINETDVDKPAFTCCSIFRDVDGCKETLIHDGKGYLRCPACKLEGKEENDRMVPLTREAALAVCAAEYKSKRVK